MIEAIRTGIRDLHPGYFALVMATGIVSIASMLEELTTVARLLFVLNNVFYGTLWLLTLTRLVLDRARVVSDLTSHSTSPAFLTTVAGTCVLGSQYVIIAGDHRVATALWIFGIALWVLLIYVFMASITVAEPKPGIDAGLSGAWLLATVSTQSIAVLGALLAPSFSISREPALFLSLTAFLLGCMFYLMIINLIFYRFSFLRLRPEAMTPPYWINMGAVAITTLAGARLILDVPHWPLLEVSRPFLIGCTLFSWATASWWIPLLVILGIWRHIVKRQSLAYSFQFWSIVFPIGMYATATLQLARALELPFLSLIHQYATYVALAAWAATLTGLASTIIRHFSRGTRSESDA